jgi:hypothetical protein
VQGADDELRLYHHGGGMGGDWGEKLDPVRRCGSRDGELDIRVSRGNRRYNCVAYYLDCRYRK